jgi:hypothetical protein
MTAISTTARQPLAADLQVDCSLVLPDRTQGKPKPPRRCWPV